MSISTVYDCASSQLSATNLGMFRNRIINGDMRIDQRGSSNTAVTASGVYAMDRFVLYRSLTSGGVSFQQSVLPSTLHGYSKCAKLTGTTSVNVSGAGAYLHFLQFVEGLNIADLAWGTSSAAPITISFSIYSNATGTYSVSLRNASVNRSYVANYTITTANTWQKIVLTVPGDTAGTWATDTSFGIGVGFTFGASTTYQAPASETWQSGNYLGTSLTSTSFGTSTVYITGVQLERGTNATPFEVRPYGLELQLCQRYYEKSYNDETAPGSATSVGVVGGVTYQTAATANISPSIIFKVSKRGTPTINIYDTAGTLNKVSDYNNGFLTNKAINGSIQAIGRSSFALYANQTAIANIFFHYTAEAEL